MTSTIHNGYKKLIVWPALGANLSNPVKVARYQFLWKVNEKVLKIVGKNGVKVWKNSLLYGFSILNTIVDVSVALLKLIALREDLFLLVLEQ